jgi:hypothetical protein
MVFNYFKKIPPLLSIPLFYAYICIALLLRFLFASVYGAFVLACSLYLYCATFTSIQPLTAHQLVEQLLSLPSGYKVAILTSFVTITGFVVAFHTATINWQNQMRAQLKVQVANEIENFFAIVTSNITTTQFYINSLINIVNEIQKGASVEESSFNIGYAQEKKQEYMAARDTLSQASVEVHRLIGRNNNLLLTGWGLLSGTQMAADALTAVSKAMWVHIPIVNMDDPDHIQEFLNQVNITECNNYLEVCETNYGKISGLSGGVQGYLTAPIWGFPLPMFINLVFNKSEFKAQMRKFHKHLNDES